MKYKTFLGTFAALAVSVGIADAKPRYLASAEIKKLITGKCSSYVAEESKGTICYEANGSITYDDSEYGKGTGKWQVRGNKVCERYANVQEDSGCSKVQTTDRKGYYLMEDGTLLRFR